MAPASHRIVLLANSPARGLTLDRASEMSGMHPEMILEFVRADLVHVTSRDRCGAPVFREHHVIRLRQIEHLRSVERVNLRTIRYLLKLQDRLDAAERELDILRKRSHDGPLPVLDFHCGPVSRRFGPGPSL